MFLARKYSSQLALLFAATVGATACSDSPSSRAVVIASDTIAVPRAQIELRNADSTTFISEPASLAISDSAVFVADGATGSIFQFSRRGQFVRSIGARGHGLGEFGAATAMVVVGDSILAISDAALKRVSLFSILRNKFISAIAIPGGVPFSLTASGDTLILGVLDVTRKTSIVRMVVGDSAATQLGAVVAALGDDPAFASAYPFSVAAPATLGYRVGFHGSNIVYHLNANGAVLDSISPPTRRRKGVPNDLAAQFANNSAPTTSVLNTIGRLSNGGAMLLYVDFTTSGKTMAGNAFLSTLSKFNVMQCTDVRVPLFPGTRPMFAMRADTLFTVQNALLYKEQVIATMLSTFTMPECES